MYFKVCCFEVHVHFALWTLEVSFLLNVGPWQNSQNRGAAVLGFPARRLIGGEGFVGEKREETEAHLMVVLDGSGAAGRWVAGDVQGRRPWELGSGELG